MTSKAGRLSGRNGSIWQEYLHGATEAALATKHSLSQARVSQILSEVRATIPPVVLDQIAKAEADRVALLYAETMKILMASHPLVSIQRGSVIWAPLAEDGTMGANKLDEDGVPIGARYVPLEDAGPKLAAINTALKIHERIAKTYGTDSAQKIESDATVRYVYEGVDTDAV